MEEYTLLCEDSMDGILTGIYEAYQLKKNEEVESHDRIHLYTGKLVQPSFCMHYIQVKSDLEKSRKVIRTLIDRFGEENYYMLCLAMVSDSEKKADAVYHTVVYSLQGKSPDLFAKLQDDYILHAFTCQRKANNELMHLRGFLRFQELEKGILYAKIGPKSQILPFLMEHFADRFPSENFMIYDESHRIFGLHPKQKKWYLLQDDSFQERNLIFSKEEDKYAEMFCHFCDSVSIKDRQNEKLQMNMLPLRFRGYMTEFQTENSAQE